MPDLRLLERDVKNQVDGEVRFDAGSRAAYSADGSNFRQVPIGVVVPGTVEAAVQAVAVCRQHGAPVLSRGGGTSLAGQSTNTAVMLNLESGCCGLAGNFGLQPGHAEVSRVCAERVLLPRLRVAAPDAVVLADGFSCRTQIHELDSGGSEAMHIGRLARSLGRSPARLP